ncbi:MAG: glycosyltransferase [Gammaproteobacteria bacterium]|nr:glycosyltransferase [Gammaproteobacteria bacterium]
MTADTSRSLVGPTLNNTALVVVTYQPDAEFQQRLEIAAAQFPATIVVDNTGVESCELSGLCPEQMRFIRNHSNLGLGAALNQGCEAVLEAGFEWVVTLDQDSLLEEEFLRIMIQGWNQSEEKAVVLGSNYFSVSRGAYKINPEQQFSTRPLKTVITAGCLMHLGSWRDLGRFREDFFIDSIDHEFCLRVRGAGLGVRINCRPGMRHTIGDKLDYRYGLKRLAPFSHSPLRKYTSARNSMRTILEYARQEPGWCLRKLAGLSAELLSIIILESGKSRRLKSFLLGLKHGWQGKMGPIPDVLLHD